MSKDELQSCEALRDDILKLLKEMNLQNQMILDKFERWETQQHQQNQKIILTGGVSGALVSLCIEFIKTKFGG